MTRPAQSLPVPNPSALTTLISTTDTPLAATTHQIFHNLQHQQLWTSLKIHDLPTKFPISLISGIPPHRVYTHPDEQLYMVERGLREEDVELDRMYVIPTVQGQPWSLEKMAAVFDALPGPADEEVEAEAEAEEQTSDAIGDGTNADKAARLAEYYEYRAKARRTGVWGAKRLLLAMVDAGMGGEGTVVYYIVQEGTVKPRQN
ncbi:tRNA-splicing endonuclease subunit Sen15 [Aspergillus aurantiobrunneus]